MERTAAVRYTIVLERGDDGGWGAMAPDLPGLLLLGDSRDEVIAQAPDAIADYLDAMREAGFPLPEARHHAVSVDAVDVEVTAA
jgi:predicted RNase H-like HicB family nuclease